MTSRQEAHLAELAATLTAAAPAGWRRLHCTAAVVADHTSIRCLAERDGSPPRSEPVPTPPASAEVLARLRAAMATPGRGAWFGMTLTVTATGHVETTFDHDHEPHFLPPLGPEAYARDEERYPRDPDARPAWLRERLSWAALSPRQRRQADLGLAALREPAPMGGSRPLFPVTPLPEDDAVQVTSARTGARAHVTADETVHVTRAGVPVPRVQPARPAPPDLLAETAAPALAALLADQSGLHAWPPRDGVPLRVGDLELDWTVRPADHGYTLTHRNRGQSETTEASHYADLARLLLLTLSRARYRTARPRLTRFDLDPAVTLGGTRRAPAVRWSADGQQHQVQGPALHGLVLPFAAACRGSFEQLRRSLTDPAGRPLLGKRTTDSLTVPLDRAHLPRIARWLADVKADWHHAPGVYDVHEPPHLPGQLLALGVAGEAELILVADGDEYAVHDHAGALLRTPALDQAVRALAVEWLTARDARPRPPQPPADQRAALRARFAAATLDDIERALARP